MGEFARIETFTFFALGTECSFYLPEGAREIAVAAQEEIERIEYRFSRYRNDSYLSEINRAAGAGAAITVDPETAQLIDYAFAAWQRSDGAFDLTTGVLREIWDFKERRVPSAESIARTLPRIGMDKLDWTPPRLRFRVAQMEMDFGGMGKEYAADQAAEIFRQAGLVHGLIDLGGDLRAVGPRPDGAPWQVQVRNPFERAASLGTIELSTGGLATSGDYERSFEIEGVRYSHLLDPRTGWPVSGLCSATVVADSCLVAGTLSTIAMLKGAEGPTWLDRTHLPYWCVDRNGKHERRGL